ncbi:MAG TPA: SDR family NAD(P)-dependent oxidoreductase [Propionibacteriaceae bacterium]|nr:SDR family NAD(P)-dependent oxidoreductase [Propionibacteriaceae bacterium]
MNTARPLAVVTGASKGIGFELARIFAENGFDLLINSEDASLDRAAEELRAGGASVTPVRADLTTYDGVQQLYAAVQETGRPVDAVALNAGIGQGGAFVDNDLADELDIINLNVISTVHLAKLVVRDMVARKSGRVLFTSSIAATMPGPFQAVYNASKSFVQSFAEALRNELKDTGVSVTALMPGPTDTEFFSEAEMEDTKLAQAYRDHPAQVAQQGFDALMAGKEKVVAGSLKTKAQALGNAVTPDKLKSQAHRQMAKPGSADS